MSEKKLKRQLLKNKLFNKRRLVILNEDTFEETFSLKLNLMNVFVVATVGAILIIFSTTYIIAFTPLREYIPGYASTKLKQDALSLAIKSDSLENKIKTNEQYLSSIKKILTGQIDAKPTLKDTSNTNEDLENLEINPSKQELELREQVGRQDKYNLFSAASPKVSFVLFKPASGKIVKMYNPAQKNYTVELALASNSPIKAVAPGIVLFADWTPSNGYVVIVRHKDELLSVYRNLDYLNKAVRDQVKSGEVLGQSGSMQNQNSNFKFELWKDGFPINPSQFINFQ